MGRTTILDERHVPGREWNGGVSLHGHTSCSREELKFLSGFRGEFPLIPMVLRAVARHHEKTTGETLDLRRASWRPPLPPKAALALEIGQLEHMGLRPLVSLSDHDEIAACLEIGRGHPNFGRVDGSVSFHVLPCRGTQHSCRALASATGVHSASFGAQAFGCSVRPARAEGCAGGAKSPPLG